jgi:hypothetical protein
VKILASFELIAPEPNTTLHVDGITSIDNPKEVQETIESKNEENLHEKLEISE